MDRQDVFNRVSKHLLTQNSKSEGNCSNSNITTCKYRDSQGRKCAIGCLIPNELYKDEFDSALDSDIRNVIQNYSAINVLGFEVNEIDLDLLSRLQNIHDHESTINWRNSLMALAATWGLIFNEAI